MLHTALCDLVDIEHPIIQAGMGPFTSAGLVAAVSEAGGLGSLGASNRPADDLVRQIERIRDLTNRPFAVNHLVPTLDEAAFAATLAAKPAVVSFALGDPGDLVARCHDAGCLVMHQVTTVTQAEEAARRGVDLIIAQGSESGGFGGSVSALPLIPQIVDAVRPLPVVAAGGIFDGRGLAAALVLGAVGVNLGTVFLAAQEAPVADGWKQAILAASSEDAVKFETWNHIIPLPGRGGYGTVPRTLRTAFIDHWSERPIEAEREADRLQGEIVTALQADRFHEFVPFGGQTAGGIKQVLPVAEIVRRLIEGAEEALTRLAPPV